MKKRSGNDRGGKNRVNDSKSVDSKEEVANNAGQNQGFSDWLRSTDGIDMMRLFVIANSLVLFVTMGWPTMQEAYTIVREYFLGEDDY